MKNTFKKITSVILAMFILMTVSVTAFAAPGSGTPVYPTDSYEAIQYCWYNGYVEDMETEHEWILATEDSNWIYYILEDGTIAVGPYNQSDYVYGPDSTTEMIVPSSLDGYKVTKVFRMDGDNLLSVVIPDTVTELGTDCFRNINTLKRVVLPTSITKMNVSSFELTDNVELYYTGSEEQWNDIEVWHYSRTGDDSCWVVTDFNWLGKTSDDLGSLESVNNTGVKAIHYNVDPDTLPPVEDLIEEEKPAEPTFWEKVAQAFQNFSDSIVVFFEKVANWFASIFA